MNDITVHGVGKPSESPATMSGNNTSIPAWQAPPLPKIAHGKGSYVYDSDGKRYIDGSGGPAVFCIGHGNEEVNTAIKQQLDRIAHGYRYTFSSDPLQRLQQIIADGSGGTLRHSVVVCGGSEAVESSLKIALQYQSAIGEPGRRRFIARERSWHGNTLGALAVSGFRQRRAVFEGALVEASFVSPANVYRPPQGVSPEDIPAFCAAELEAEIGRIGAERVCAFIFEPVVGAAGGCVPAPPGYAAAMRAVCERHGVLMIADEVMCGVGRCGTWRALAHDDVEPDVMSIAKGLGGGYLPLGASVFSDRVAEAIYAAHGEALTGHTFAGHTTVCAAGVAVQTIIERERLIEQVHANGPRLTAMLRDAIGDQPWCGDIRGRGYFQAVEFVRDRHGKEPFDPQWQVFARIRDTAFENGLICYPVGGNVDGVRGDHAILAPPYNASDDELGEMVEKLARSAASVFATVPVA